MICRLLLNGEVTSDFRVGVGWTAYELFSGDCCGMVIRFGGVVFPLRVWFWCVFGSAPSDLVPVI
jgi:hypothetical protein